MLANSIFYAVKPLVPRSTQLYLRRKMIEFRMRRSADRWPIDESAGVRPTNAPEWPDGKRFALVLTHDVEKIGGQERVCQVMQLEMQMGLRSCFNFVPERYEVSAVLRRHLTQNGFEVGVHDLNHDGRLFGSRFTFTQRAPRINKYLQEWNAVGFRAGAMHHNLEWIAELNVEYDCSTFDTDPFEPQPDGVGTIYPFEVPRADGQGSYIELPYTLPQDFTVFVLMKEQGIDFWTKKLDWIAARGGMALLNTHPDYMCFGAGTPRLEEYSAELYLQFLKYVIEKYHDKFWCGLPREVARLWKGGTGRALAASVSGELWGTE